MFLRTDVDLPKDIVYKPELDTLGFQVNNEGQFVSLPEKVAEERKEQNVEEHHPEFFRYHHTDCERDNDRRDEAFRICARKEVLSKLLDQGLKECYLTGPSGTRIVMEKPHEPHVRILISDRSDLITQQDVVIINGENSQDLAVWAWRHLRREGGIRSGSAVGLLKELGYGDVSFEGEAITEDGLSELAVNELEQLKHFLATSQREKPTFVDNAGKREIGVIIFNPGQLLYSPSEDRSMSSYSWFARETENALTEPYMIKDQFNKVPGHHTAAEHVSTVLRDVVPRLVSHRAHLHFVGLGDGAGKLLAHLDATLVADPGARIGGYIGQLALVQPSHAHKDLRSPELLEILKRSKGWITSTEAKGTLLHLPEGMTSPNDHTHVVRRLAIKPDVPLDGPQLPDPSESVPTDRRLKGFQERLKLSQGKRSVGSDSTTSPTKLDASGKNALLSPGGLRSAHASDHMMFPLEVDCTSPGKVGSPTVDVKAKSALRITNATSDDMAAKEAGHQDSTIPSVQVSVPATGQSPSEDIDWHVASKDIDSWLRETADASTAHGRHLGTQIPEPRLGTPESGESNITPPSPGTVAAVEAMAGRLQRQFDSRPELPHLEEHRHASAGEDAHHTGESSSDTMIAGSATSHVNTKLGIAVAPAPVSSAISPDFVTHNAGNTPAFSSFSTPEPANIAPGLVLPSDRTMPTRFANIDFQREGRDTAPADPSAVANAETATEPSVTTPPPIYVHDKFAIFDPAVATEPSVAAELPKLEMSDPWARKQVLPSVATNKDKQFESADSDNDNKAGDNSSSAPADSSIISTEILKLKASGAWALSTPLPSAADDTAVSDPVKDHEEHNKPNETNTEAPHFGSVSCPTYSGGVELYSEMLFPTAIHDILEFIFPPPTTQPDTAIARHRAQSAPLPGEVKEQEEARALALKGIMPLDIPKRKRPVSHP